MTAFPADVLGQMSPGAAAIERGNIYRREALWSATTGELIAKARQERLDSWSDDGIFKTAGKAALEGAGLFLNKASVGLIPAYDAGPRSGGSAILSGLNDTFDFNIIAQAERFGGQAAAKYAGVDVPRDSAGRIDENPDDAHRAITNRIADDLFYGAIHDPAFMPDDNMLARYGFDGEGQPFDQDTLLKMAKSGSEFELAHIRASALHQRDQERRMGRFSAPVQFAYGIVGSLGDPISFGSGALAGMGSGAVAGAFLRTTSGTLARMSSAGFVARTVSGFVAKNTAKGLVPGVGFSATLAAGENVAQSYALNTITGDDYSWRQAAIDATIGAGFSAAGSTFNGALKLIRGNERMTIADTGLAATTESNFYFEEVPGHRPEATRADLASADQSAAHMFVVGENAVLPREAMIRGRTVLTSDGRRGRVVETTGGFDNNPYQVLVDIDGKVEAHGVETVGIDRTRTPFVGDRVRLEDGTVGTIDRLEGKNGEAVIVKSLADASEHRVPAWLLDQREGEATVRKGVTAFDPDGRAVIALLKSRDISTGIHELGHPFRRTLRTIDTDAADTLNGYLGEASDDWSTHSEERFARMWERYVAEGKAPTKALEGVFAHFKAWLTDLWDSIKGESPEQLTPEMRTIFGKLLGEGQDGGTGAFDRAGANYKRVRDELISVAGKDGKHTPESSALLALIHANAGAVARASGKGFDDYFANVITGFQKQNIGPDRFMRRMLPTNRAALIPSDIRYDYIKKRWERTLAKKSEKAAKTNDKADAGLAAIREARIDSLAAKVASDVDKNRWISAANRLQVEDPNSVTRPLSKDEYDAIIGELSLKRLSTVNGIVTVVPGMNGHARLVDGKLEISPYLAAMPAEQRLTMVRNAILARDIVLILGEEAWKGNPVPPPSPKALSAWMDRKGLLPHDEAGPVAIAAVNTMERMHNPVVAADTLIGGTKDIPPETGGTTADLPSNPDESGGGGRASPLIESPLGPIAHIEKMVTDTAAQSGVLDSTAMTDEAGYQTGNSSLGTSFVGKLPADVLDIIDRHPETRPFFSISKAGERGTNGADSLAEMGSEAYEKAVLELAQSDYSKSLRVFGSDGAFGFLDRVRDLWMGRRSIANEENRGILWARRTLNQVKDGRKGVVKDSVLQAERDNLAQLANNPKKYTAEKKAIEKRNANRVTETQYARAQEVASKGKTSPLSAEYLDTNQLPEGSEFTIAGERAEIVQRDDGLYVKLNISNGRPLEAHASLPSTLPIDPGSLYVPKLRKQRGLQKWKAKLADKAAEQADTANAIEYAAYLERQRAEHDAIATEVADYMREERASPHADQATMYDAAYDPQFATMYEQTGPVVGGTPTTAKGFKPDPSDPKVFSYADVIGGKIKGWIGKVDIIGRADHLSDSNSKFMQDASAILFDTSLRNENNARNASPVEIGVRQKVNAIFGGYLSKSGAAFDAYASANKIPLLQRGEGRIAFEREVGRLSSMPSKPSDPHIAAAVEAARSAIKESHAIALANGVNLPEFDPAYFMRLWSAGRKATLIAKMESLGIKDAVKHIDTLLAKATLAKRSDLTPAEAAALGEHYNRRIDEVSKKSALDRMRVMSNLENVDRTTNMLIEDGMDEAAARALATKIAGSPTTGSQPNPKSGRGWVLDDRHSMTVQGPQGAFTFSVADLMETDAGTIVSHYSRAMVAEGAMTSALRELSTRYGKSISTVDSLLAEADKELAREQGMTAGKRQRQVKRLSTGISLIKGLPTHETTGLTQTMQALQKVNYIRMQGGFVISAGFELAGMASRASFGAMLKTMPLAREVYNQMKAGKVDGQVARAILSSMGAGYEGQIRAYLPELEARDPTTGGGGRFLNAANKKLGKGQTAVSRLTFFEQLNTFSQVWARTTYLQHLTDMARRDQSPSAKRLAQIGMSEATWTAIRADLKKNATPSQGAGGILFDINLDGMDPVNRTRLLASVDAKARELIQEPTIGGSDYWLETPGARMVNQYRGFALAAYQKQLLTNIQNFDGESAAYFTATMGLGTLQYTLLSYLDSRGADDPESDFERRTTLARLGYGGFSRAAFSGIAPTLIDSALFPLGIKPLQGGRTTGQSGYSIFNFPTQQLFQDAIPGAIGLARSAVDPTYDLSEQDVKGARSLVPLSRFPGVQSITNSMIRDADLPKRPQKEQTDILKLLDGDQ